MRRTRFVWGGFACALLAATSLGCQQEVAAEPDCSTLRDEFQAKVWAPVLGKTCITCHQPGGLAWAQRARFSIVPATYPGFVDTNIEALRAMLGYEFEGQPLVLAKPSGATQHGGGEVLDKDSREYKDLAAFLERLAAESPTANAPTAEVAGGECAPEVLLPEVARLDPAATLRKASLQLAGRLPTDAELASVSSGDATADEASLAIAVRALLDEPAFDDWLLVSWNDVLLTDLYGSYAGRSLGLLNGTDFPNAHDGYYDQIEDDALKREVGNAVMREPLALIIHVVRQGRPFSEILTADYSLFNPLSAKIYDTDVAFGDSYDPNDWRTGKMKITREGKTIAWPHAGILSSPMILNRFPTTATNLNRHRAWWLLRTFLATDILTVADRPVDPDKASQFDYPWRQDNQCVVCHAVIDPIAGAWSGFDPGDQERYFPDRAPPANVFDPGFGEASMPPDPAGGRLAWLAKKVTLDARFPLAIARLTFQMVTGRAPIEHPRNTTSPDYATQEEAWRDFDHHLKDVVDRFVAAQLDYRTLVVALVIGPYFRAQAVDLAAVPERVDELAEVGTARLLTPELLEKKIAAAVGMHWTRGYDKTPYLLSDFEIIYGGIDSDRVSERLTIPNGVMAAVQARMANEVACTATAWDLGKPKTERLLFPTVAIDDQPTTASGDVVPAAVARIKDTIVHLHARLLGEHLSPEDPEVARTFALFKEVLDQGRKNVADKSESDSLRCSAKKDPLTGQDLAAERKVERDPNYTVRAWMAVVTYLLSDYRFLYE
ncbi:MAG: hypothetical protein JNJ59_23100 [Deltaproteobacteria bacterium]|nr:hypothetical protein [Deltaproteobacteria bacterium]